MTIAFDVAEGKVYKIESKTSIAQRERAARKAERAARAGEQIALKLKRNLDERSRLIALTSPNFKPALNMSMGARAGKLKGDVARSRIPQIVALLKNGGKPRPQLIEESGLNIGVFNITSTEMFELGIIVSDGKRPATYTLTEGAK